MKCVETVYIELSLNVLPLKYCARISFKGCDSPMPESIKKIIFFIGIALVALIFFLITNDSKTESNGDKKQLHANATVGITETSIELVEEVPAEYAIVDVKGEVATPGVYELSFDSRVNDVIKLAGGFTTEADETQINLAQKVQDEMIIIVYKEGEEGTPTNNSTGSDSSSQKIRINTATQEEIETLNGIGPSKAQAIIQYREENGLFKTPEDLLQVSGIGEKTLQNFIDQIQIP